MHPDEKSKYDDPKPIVLKKFHVIALLRLTAWNHTI
jgi:hypothetical protein